MFLIGHSYQLEESKQQKYISESKSHYLKMQ